MILIPYKDVSAFNFQTALQKLAGTSMDGHSAYKVKKIFAGVKKGQELVSEKYKAEIMPKFAKLDAEGKFDIEKFEVDPAKEAEFVKAQDEFGLQNIEIDRPKLTLQDIRNVQLSPIEQLALEPVLDDSQGDAPAQPMMPQGIRQVK